MWSDADNVQYDRLAREMAEDANLQFRAFALAYTGALVVLGYLLSTKLPGFENTAHLIWLRFLLPVFLTVAGSMIILNRARTRNRKSAYVICFLESKLIPRAQRLRSNGIEPGTQLPWETALHYWLRRTPHLPPVLKWFFSLFFALEICCFIGAGANLFGRLSADYVFVLEVIAFVLLFCSYVFVSRWRIKALLALRAEDSIQGFIARWIVYSKEKMPYLEDRLKTWFGNDWREKAWR